MTNTRSVDESERHREMVSFSVCVFITAVPIIKLFAWGEGDSGGHVLRETKSRGLCGLVCPGPSRFIYMPTSTFNHPAWVFGHFGDANSW